ncbi:MAG: glycosyltransferase [Polyangiaceae bacterium]|nr:glycosyltransferase [Polyangiaceae bacterium]
MNAPTFPYSSNTYPSSERTQGHDEWPRKIAILNDYVRVPYANGSSFASQMLYREFARRGHETTVVGPHDPTARPEELPARHISLPSVPLRFHPGVYLPFPGQKALARVAQENFDMVLAQSGSRLTELGVWLRQKHRVPMLCVNTVHLPSVANVILPDSLRKQPLLQRALSESIVPWAQRQNAALYNQTDGVVVLSSGLKRYWEELGVRCPIHVIPRSVDPKIFNLTTTVDPYPAHMKRGYRLLVVCRHTREKEVERLLNIFASLVAVACPDATLTLIGDGPDHGAFKAHAAKLGVADRTLFLGEKPLTEVPLYYQHADLFVYTSLSETYGQVVSEAMWCGLPVVALADNMGVSEQVQTDRNGVLIPNGQNVEEANWRFANAVLRLLRDPALRVQLGQQASQLVRHLRHPERGIQAYYEAFASAREHLERESAQSAAKSGLGSLVSMSVVHGLLALGGCLRPPSAMDLASIRQPVWSELPRVTEMPPSGSKPKLQVQPLAI